MSFRLEGALSSMLDKLLDLFRLLYLKKYLSPDQHRALMDGLRDVHIAVHKGLLDYKDYISIKSQRNVAMTTYPFGVSLCSFKIYCYIIIV